MVARSLGSRLVCTDTRLGREPKTQTLLAEIERASASPRKPSIARNPIFLLQHRRLLAEIAGRVGRHRHWRRQLHGSSRRPPAHHHGTAGRRHAARTAPGPLLPIIAILNIGRRRYSVMPAAVLGDDGRHEGRPQFLSHSERRDGDRSSPIS